MLISIQTENKNKILKTVHRDKTSTFPRYAHQNLKKKKGKKIWNTDLKISNRFSKCLYDDVIGLIIYCVLYDI